MGCSKILALVMAAMVVVMATTRRAEGQSTPSCVAKLTPCADYINATNPPAACCNPLRDILTNEHACLCNLFNTPGLLASYGINVTEAVKLPGHCNISDSGCSASAPSSPTPPATPGKDSGVGKIASTGMASILLFWASVMLY